MAARAALLGDEDASAPATWEPGLRDGGFRWLDAPDGVGWDTIAAYAGEASTAADSQRSAEELLATESREDSKVWAVATLDDVKDGFSQVPYPPERVHFVKGKVEETIPEHAPKQISILRLDTDWYESTQHELLHRELVEVDVGNADVGSLRSRVGDLDGEVRAQLALHGQVRDVHDRW